MDLKWWPVAAIGAACFLAIVALAALLQSRGGLDPLLLVLAADHLIADVARFQDSVRAAVPLASAGKIVTFGIVPDRAETGYGYIRRGKPLGDNGFTIEKFEEKPDMAAADVVVVVAGMDGALPSVVAGLTDRLVVAVPTSVGYGAAFEGLAPLLTMLTACAPGVLVVNIDNGFGAGVAAARIARSSAGAP